MGKISARILTKYDTLENWSAKNPKLLQGELAVVNPGITIEGHPTTLLKSGLAGTDGKGVAFNECPYIWAYAADVYDWAKAETKPTYDATEISGLDNYIVGHLPTVNNGKLTISLNGKETAFTANQAGNTSLTLGTAAAYDEGHFDLAGAASGVQTALTGATSDQSNVLTLHGIQNGVAEAKNAAAAAQTTANSKIGSITIKSGDDNGTIKYSINGGAATPVAITGLKALAFKDSLTAADVGLNLVANKGLDTEVSNSGNYITSGAVKSYVDQRIIGQSQYLGQVKNADELAALNPDSKGDFCWVGAAFGSYHVGDLLICESVKTGSTAATWSLVHGEINKNTWQRNTKDSNGYVDAGNGYANKVWKTDADGNPGWRDDANSAHSHDVGDGLLLDGKGNSLSGVVTYKANLNSYTKNANAVGGKLYPVELDKNGKLAVSVPWTDTNTDTNTSHNHSSGVGLRMSGTAGITGGTTNYKAALLDEAANTATAVKGGNPNQFYAVETDAKGNLAVSVPWYNSDTKVTSVDNHYSPTADASATISCTASGGTASWGASVISGFQVKRDAKGHVVDVVVTSSTKTPNAPSIGNGVLRDATGTAIFTANQGSDSQIDVIYCGSATDLI